MESTDADIAARRCISAGVRSFTVCDDPELISRKAKRQDNAISSSPHGFSKEIIRSFMARDD